MQTSTSLTFFTAIFVALGGALAEELMICCRHVRTELYIYRLGIMSPLFTDHVKFTKKIFGFLYRKWSIKLNSGEHFVMRHI